MCDLADLVPDWSIGRVGRCYWEFKYTRVNVCARWMCHWRHRPEAQRAAVRTGLRGVARE